MSLSVGSINRSFSYASTNKYTSNNKPQNNTMNSQPQNAINFGEKRRSGMKALVPIAFALPISGALAGCYAEAEAWAYAEAKDSAKNCCHCHCYPLPKDTVWMHDSVPYVVVERDTVNDTIIKRDTLWQHDSIPVIINHYDTAYIKDKYESPVIDTLNKIIDDLGGDPERKYIPLRVSFIDEMDTKYRRFLFDGRSSSRDQVVYDSKKSPWSDDEATFIIDTPLDEKEKYILSLTGDGKLFAMKMVPKLGVTNPQGLDDYMMAPTNYVFDRDQAAKLIKKFNVARDQVGREYAGSLAKDAKPKSIMITNPYDAKWRCTNVDVITADAPDEE